MTQATDDNATQGVGSLKACPVDPEPIVRVKHISKAFDTIKVLNNVSIDFHRGEVTVILGPSGTGKSVLLKHIVGLLQPDAGEVHFNGERVDQLSEAALVEKRKQIGFLFQMAALFDSMSVEQNIMFPLIEHTDMPLQKRRERVDEVLRMVMLSGVDDKMPAQLSGGQRKRVALARAIVLNPCLVLYDEPTTGLDPIRADVINELIIGLNKTLGISSIVVTHDMASANKIADRMLLLYDGRVICDGDPETFLRSENELVKRFIRGQAAEHELANLRDTFNGADAAASMPQSRSTPDVEI